jgi:ribosomal protein L14E/L6E/L27E
MIFEPGQTVISKAGRDRGKVYVVYRVLDNRYVLVVDGSSRRVERPKKKNVRHLQLYTQLLDAGVRERVRQGKVTNQELRRALAEMGVERSGQKG